MFAFLLPVLLLIMPDFPVDKSAKEDEEIYKLRQDLKKTAISHQTHNPRTDEVG